MKRELIMIEELEKEVIICRFDLGANCAYIGRVNLLKLLFKPAEPWRDHGSALSRDSPGHPLLDAVQCCAPFPLKINIKLLLRKQAFL